MPIRIDSRSADFASRFKAFLATKREVSADIDAATRAIVEDVAARGDHVGHLLDREPEARDARRATPHREHHDVRLVVPADPQGALGAAGVEEVLDPVGHGRNGGHESIVRADPPER